MKFERFHTLNVNKLFRTYVDHFCANVPLDARKECEQTAHDHFHEYIQSSLIAFHKNPQQSQFAVIFGGLSACIISVILIITLLVNTGILRPKGGGIIPIQILLLILLIWIICIVILAIGLQNVFRMNRYIVQEMQLAASKQH